MKKQKLQVPNLSFEFTKIDEQVSLIYELTNIDLVKKKKIQFIEVNLKKQKLKTSDASTRLF